MQLFQSTDILNYICWKYDFHDDLANRDSLMDFQNRLTDGTFSRFDVKVFSNGTHEVLVVLQDLLDEIAQKLAEHGEALAGNPAKTVREVEASYLNASASAEALPAAASVAEVAVTATLGEDGGLRFHFKLPRGLTGAQGPQGVTPRFRVNGASNEWEISYDDGASWTSSGTLATGPRGEGFRIVKFYETEAQMRADAASDVVVGDLVAIRSNVNDEKNAAVYSKTKNGFEFLLDFSGATGIQGPVGPQGDDYVLTDADMDEIAERVFAMLPSAEGTAL